MLTWFDTEILSDFFMIAGVREVKDAMACQFYLITVCKGSKVECLATLNEVTEGFYVFSL